MSSRKRPGGAVDSRPARKRSRLLPSSAGGTSQAEPRDLEQSGTPAFEPAGGEVIDLTGESSEPEVIIISDDESAVEREQRQQQPHLFRASEDSAEPPARDAEEEPREDDGDWLIFDFDPPYWSDEDSEDREQNQQQSHLSRSAENSAEPLPSRDEEEPREDDGDWLIFDFDPPYWSDEDSEDREQNQQQSHLSRSAENSAGPLPTRDEEEPRDNDGAWPAGPASTPAMEDEDSEVQDEEQRQQYPLGSREAENSAELGARDSEEEPRDNNDSINSSEWPDRFESPPTWQNDITEDWEGSQQYPLGSRSAENSLEPLASNLQQEPRDIEFYPPGALVILLNWQDDNAELLQVHEQERRNVTLNSPEQVDGPGNGTGANDAPVADSAPAEQASEEEDTESSDSVHSSAQPGVVIRCPICMDFYSEIVQSGRQLVATLCGHVFCSRCLPIALETNPICPTCRVELTPDLYIPLYI